MLPPRFFLRVPLKQMLKSLTTTRRPYCVVFEALAKLLSQLWEPVEPLSSYYFFAIDDRIGPEHLDLESRLSQSGGSNFIQLEEQ